MNQFAVRPVESKHIAGIRDVAEQSWNHTYKAIYPQQFIDDFVSRAYSANRLQQAIERDRSRAGGKFAVAVDAQDTVLGFAQAGLLSDGIYELFRIYVLPETQRSGVGTSLLNDLVNSLPDMKTVFAWVEKENHSGRSFYERKGFRFTEEKSEEIMGYTTVLVRYDLCVNA